MTSVEVVRPVLTTIMGFNIVQLFARLFLWQLVSAARNLADALPREHREATLLFFCVAAPCLL